MNLAQMLYGLYETYKIIYVMSFIGMLWFVFGVAYASGRFARWSLNRYKRINNFEEEEDKKEEAYY